MPTMPNENFFSSCLLGWVPKSLFKAAHFGGLGEDNRAILAGEVFLMHFFLHLGA